MAIARSLTFDIGASQFCRRADDIDNGPPLKKLRADGMKGVCEDYILFTYAPMILYGGLEHNPVQEWINISKVGEVVHFLNLPWSVFNFKLGDCLKATLWNSLLWAVQKEHWASLALHIGTIALLNRDTKVLTRALCQCIPIYYDGKKNSLAPTASVYVFSVDSNFGSITIAKPIPNVIPHLILQIPEPDTVILADSIFREAANPYKEIEDINARRYIRSDNK